jgi:hypothetical protein
MRRAILALATACESLGLRAMDAGLRIVDAAAWVRDHVDPKRHGDAAVQERERMDADREAFDRFMASLEELECAHVVVIGRAEPVAAPRRNRAPFSFN